MGYGATFGILGGGRGSLAPPPKSAYVPVHDVCSTLSQNFTPIAPSCVEISSTVQTNKQTKKSKLNITPNATLWRDNNTYY